MPVLPMPFDLAALRKSVRPFRLHWFPRLRSTNDHAAVLRRRRDLFAPAIVLTGHQMAGRGRGNNTWWSGAGSLTVTFAIAAGDAIAPHQVPLIAGLAVRNAIADFTGHDDIQLKWPNDLLFDGRKLAGLLCERIDGIDLIGLGMNVNVNVKAKVPLALRDRITSIQQISGAKSDITELLIAIARHLHQRVSDHDRLPFSRVLVDYDRHHALRGRRVTVTQSASEPVVRGLCKGMDAMGRLLVANAAGLHRIIAGHVERDVRQR